MSPIPRANALKLASTARDLGAEALRGLLEQNETGHWTVGHIEVEGWLSRHEGYELVLAVAAVSLVAVNAAGTLRRRVLSVMAGDYALAYLIIPVTGGVASPYVLLLFVGVLLSAISTVFVMSNETLLDTVTDYYLFVALGGLAFLVGYVGSGRLWDYKAPGYGGYKPVVPFRNERFKGRRALRSYTGVSRNSPKRSKYTGRLPLRAAAISGAAVSSPWVSRVALSTAPTAVILRAMISSGFSGVE